MFRFVYVLLATAAFAHPLEVADQVHVEVGELLSYECGRQVAGLSVEASGPLFREGALLFTSVTNSEGKPLLIVTAGSGIYQVDLAHAGINRLHFDLPTSDEKGKHSFFLSYLHDPVLRSRYLEFGEDAPPVGHFDLDYLAVVPRRAATLLPHLEYAIFETSENLVNSVVGGRLKREQLTREPVRGCDHLTRENPKLAQRLQRNLDEMDLLTSGPRRPASVGP